MARERIDRWSRRSLISWLARKLGRDPTQLEYIFCRYDDSCPFKMLKPQAGNALRAWRLCGCGEGCNQKTFVQQIVDARELWR